MERLVRLHQHSDASLGDGLSTARDIVQRVAELGQTAWALTDHGTTTNLLSAYKETEKYNKEHGTNIKFIFGCEFYWTPDYFIRDRQQSKHLIILAKNQVGYYNLLKLVTIAHGNKGEAPENFYYTMRITCDDLEKYSEGLIVTSACLGGILNPRTEDGAWDKNLSYERAERFKAIFGDDFYIELQSNTMKEQKEHNLNLVKLAEDLGIKMIVADDAHYTRKEDAQTHRLLTGNVDGKYYQEDDYYIHSESEIKEKLSYLPDDIISCAIENTASIGEGCNVKIEFGGKNFPELDLNGKTPLEVVKEKCEIGWEEKILPRIPHEKWGVYRKQLEHEYDVLEKCDYLSYFLLTEDFLSWCRSQGILMGVGRGSVAGSLVAYLMDIVRIDPIEYDLVFERFAHTMRVSLPDVDNDIESGRRDEGIKYLVDKYKEVFHTRTVGTMSDKSALLAAGRHLKIPIERVREYSKRMGESLDNLSDTETIVSLAKKYIGVIDKYSIHAAAVMLFPDDANRWTAIERQTQNKTAVYVCAYDYGMLESMGLLKLDVLGLKTLDAIHGTLDMIGEDIDINNLPVDDEKTIKMLACGGTDACFQIESRGMTKLVRDLKPKSVYDMIPLVALFRPALLKSGMTESFVKRQFGKEEITYLHESLRPILEETHGIILYQEQTIKIVSALAGYSLGQADEVRRAIGKKSAEKMAVIIPQLIQDFVSNGIPEDTAKKIAELIEYFAGYGFNKSHSAAYGYTAYQTAYLKANYPVEYYTAYLNSYIDEEQEVIAGYIENIRKSGIKILPPDSRVTTNKWTIERLPNGEKAIRTAISYIKGVSNIQLPIFTTDGTINKTKYVGLVKSGAFDWIGKSRKELLREYYFTESIENEKVKYQNIVNKTMQYAQELESMTQGTKKYNDLAAKLERASNKAETIEGKIIELEAQRDLFEFDERGSELEVLGFSLKSPFSDYDTSQFAEPELGNIDKRVILCQVITFKQWKQKNGKPMAFVTVLCPSGSTYELVMFNTVYRPLEKGRIYRMSVSDNKIKNIF